MMQATVQRMADGRLDLGRGWSRRSLLVASGVAGGSLLIGERSAAAAAQAAASASLAFNIRRKGSIIGTHVASFRGDAEALIVESQVEIAVKLAFVTVFSFRQEARDRFERGRLVESDVRTDDDGEKARVQARAGGDHLVVTGEAGEHEVPLGVMHDLCFWDPAMVRQDMLVDSKTAEVAPLARSPGKREFIRVRGERTAAQRFEFSTSNSRRGSVWYTEDGRFVQALVHTRGEILNYELI